MIKTNTGQLVFETDMFDLDVNKIKLIDRTAGASDVIEMYHGYVPTTRFVGRQLNYTIICEGYEIGFIGVGSAVMAMKDRDNYIGWSKQQRLHNLTHIANNWRYSLKDNLPKNTGSKVLSLLADKAREDWKKRYGEELVLLETMVEAPRTGTVYLASGWAKVGRTVGTKYQWKRVDEVLPGEQIVKRGFIIDDKVDMDKVKVVLGNTSPKEILVKPINRRWKKILCENPKCEECVSFNKRKECSKCEDVLIRARIAHYNISDNICWEGEEWDGTVKTRREIISNNNNHKDKGKIVTEFLDIW